MELFKIGFVPVRLVDLLDVAVVTFLLYKLYEILRGSLALRVLSVVMVIFLMWRLVDLLGFVLLKSILDEFLGLGAVVLVIIFAPEIRKFLTAISKNTLFDRIIRQVSARVDSTIVYQEISDALKDLRADGDGALIVFTGANPLTEIQATGDQLNADISARLIFTIFQKASPLHDGAMIIAQNKIAAVRCILPISRDTRIPAELGMRHRAAIGLTEVSDAMVLVVSEERREISIAHNGKLSRNLDFTEVEEAIKQHFQQTIVQKSS
ncbi:MAG: diadenylate cyclase CdaA [Bacteroidota bacterium]